MPNLNHEVFKGSYLQDLCKALYKTFIRALARCNTLPSLYTLTLRSKLLEGLMHGSEVYTEQYELTLKLHRKTKLVLALDSSLTAIVLTLEHEYRDLTHTKIISLYLPRLDDDNYLDTTTTKVTKVFYGHLARLSYYIYDKRRAITPQEVDTLIEDINRTWLLTKGD